jgi:hypothetical protein
VFSYSFATQVPSPLTGPVFRSAVANNPPRQGREISMRDIFQVLREKELAVIRVQSEIAALRVVTPILAEETDRSDNELTAPAQLVATGIAS